MIESRDMKCYPLTSDVASHLQKQVGKSVENELSNVLSVVGISSF